jgi:hypothetical protein
MSTRSTATRFSGASGRVWEVPGIVVSGCERGEDERRSASSGAGRALARSGDVRMRALASLCVTGRVCAGQWRALLRRPRCLACSGGREGCPGHADACWS